MSKVGDFGILRLTALAVCLLAVPGTAQDKGADKKDLGTVSFKKQIFPILDSRCIGCHYPKDKKGGLDVSTYAAVMKGGKTANGIVPGYPEKSIFVKEIIGKDPSMPKNALPLTPLQIDLISAWIKQGARNN